MTSLDNVLLPTAAVVAVLALGLAPALELAPVLELVLLLLLRLVVVVVPALHRRRQLHLCMEQVPRQHPTTAMVAARAV